jgi:hypothetical protein
MYLLILRFMFDVYCSIEMKSLHMQECSVLDKLLMKQGSISNSQRLAQLLSPIEPAAPLSASENQFWSPPRPQEDFV